MATTTDTMARGIDNFRKRSWRPISLAQLKVVVVGEAAARDGLDDLLDYLERNPEVQRRVKLAVAPGEALKVLQVSVPVEKLVAFALPQFIVEAHESSRTSEASIGEAMTWRMSAPGYLLPRVRPSGQELVVAGAGAFRDNRLVGWVNEEECRGLAWIRGDLTNGVIEFPCVLNPRQKHAVKAAGVRRRLRVKVERGRPVFELSVGTRVDLFESIHPFESAGLAQREQGSAAAVVRDEIQDALDAGRRLRVDFFGFGEALHGARPDLWDRLQRHWNDYFAREAVVRVTGVRVSLRHLGEVR
jgi:spore germination protein KC